MKPRIFTEEQRERRAAYSRTWRLANPERKAAIDKAYREANRERLAGASKAWGEANREHRLAASRVWREANPGKQGAYGKAYYVMNKERIDAASKAYREAKPEVHRKKSANRRARKKAAFVESVDHDAVFVRDGGVCQICDKFIGATKWHIDHRIPISKGGKHSYANCQLAHATCNQKKHAKVPA